jgi:hypothetical protein
MANEEHLKLLKRGTAQWNRWRKEHPQVFPDLRGADLREVSLSNVDFSALDLHGVFLSKDLRGANFSQAILPEVDLSAANLAGATLTDAHMVSVNLIMADLRKADLRGAHLRDAKLNGANLNAADLSGADLGGANLSGAILFSTIFALVDLRETGGLAEIQHWGPSRVELHTLQLPQDGSALHFLRGAGVPNEWIDDYRARTMHSIQYHSLFISYSSKDEMPARRLYADFQAKGVRCWFAPEDLKIGTKFRQRIDEAIHLQDKLLLLISEHSIASTWVENEVEAALEKEDREQREVLFPIHLDDAVMQTSQAWVATLRRTRHIGDFTNWTDPQTYQIAFDRLLRDLKKADEPQDQETKQ